MSQRDYWARYAEQRLTRRNALRAGTGVAAGGLVLGIIGCGDSNSGGSTGDSSSLLSKPVDTLSQAKAGGNFRDFQPADVAHFDALASNSAQTVNYGSVFAYPRLLKYTTAKYPKEADGSSEGDFVESWELSADKLQVTFKLRSNIKWDARAPTNGRIADAQDVLFSWEKYKKVNASAQNIAYNAETAAASPVESLSAPDSRTLVMKLKRFDSSLFQLLTSFDHFYIMPRESDGGFDPRNEVRGHGPWLLDEYVPSARLTWRKNPDYYVKNRPFPDKWERPIVVDYAQQLAQFKSGNIWTTVARQEDIVQTKKDVPQAILLQADSFATNVSPMLSFGWDVGSVFTDTRMRQAVSMLIDRPAFSDVMDNREGFSKQGLELPVAFQTVVAPGWTGFWLDPNNEKEFGPNHKYLKLDIAEAKKLMAAAGYANGVETEVGYNQDNTYGAEYHKILDVYEGMLLAGGIKLKRNALPYTTYRDVYSEAYLSRAYAAGQKKLVGGLIHRAVRSFPTASAWIFGIMHKDSGSFHGASPDGKNPHLGDPKVNDLIEKMKLEPELQRQQALMHEVIRYLTAQAYTIPRPSAAKGFSLQWPVIGNLGVTRTYAGGNVAVETRRDWWVDSSKPPLAKA
ncbi:MAG TPA: ABC transporter substrate-binding protein [Dehalococcoidia bacterium]|nr:ABC transporter substrate-binding protein [Dehalococcoidia bacterium]